MKTRIGSLLLRAMVRVDLDRAGLVRRMGYTNLNKGRRRLDAWLKGEAMPSHQNQRRLCLALGLKPSELVKAIREDLFARQEALLAKRKLDPAYYLTIRLIPGINTTLRLPEGTSEEEAIEEGRREALRLGKRCCINTPESKNIWIDEKGRVLGANSGTLPQGTVGKKRVNLQIEDIVVS